MEQIPSTELIFKEDADIAIAADEWQQKLLMNGCFLFFNLVVCVPIVYVKCEGNPWLFVIAGVFLIIIACAVHYNQANGIGKLFNKTVIEVRAKEGEIWIKTMPFKFWFMVNKPSKELLFPRAKINIIKIANPYPHLFKLNKFVIRLRCSGEEFYIIPEYFPKGMEAELRRNSSIQI